MRKHQRLICIVLFPTLCAVICTLISWICCAHSANASGVNALLLAGMILNTLLVLFSIVFLIRHASALRHAFQIENQAYTDAMTQVRNRAALNLKIEQMNATTAPQLTLFMIDLNNLKQVNDTLGHSVGDMLICALVHCLEQAFGKIGQIYRYGGDEFVILIERAPLEKVLEARALLDKLISDYPRHGGCEFSAAIGMASRQEAQKANLHVAELLRLADVEMYRMKRTQKAAPSQIKTGHHRWMEQIDATTGILTLPAFKSRIYDALASGTVSFPCIVNFDLNFFDGYNNLFGWDAGDQLLGKLTSLAMKLCGEKGFCAHGEADSFWVFPDVDDLDALTGRITGETRFFQSQLNDLLLFPSFGVYCISDLMLPVSDMCSRAASTKRGIKGRLDILYDVYSTEDHQRRIDNMRMTSCMHHGLDSDEFLPYYQPKYASGSRKIVGAEALVRWLQAPNDAASASEFTDLFEKSGLILSLDWHMTEKVCAFLRRLTDSGRRCVPVSINFSRLHMYEKDCVERLKQIRDKYGLPAGLIGIELTETAIVPGSDRLAALITGLRDAGFPVTIDSFGDALSSLSLIKDVAVDMVKLDHTLTRVSPQTDPDHAVVTSVVALCKKLNIATVAEGVETQEEADLLTESGCDLLQGRFLSPVLSETDFSRLLESEKSGRH